MLKTWRYRLQCLPTWKKLILLAVVVILPAGVVLGAVLYRWWSVKR